MPKTCPTCGGRIQPEPELPEWLPLETWAEWVAVRKETRHPLTPTIIKAQIRKLDRWRQAGHSVAEILEYSITGGYQGLFEPKTPPKVKDVVKYDPERPTAEAPQVSQAEIDELIAEYPHLASSVH